MKLNLPLIPAFDVDRYLLVGAGGGYDHLGGFPFFHEFQQAGKTATLCDFVEELRCSSSHRPGVMPIKNLLQVKIDQDHAQTLIVVDGGVDSLMTGDEKDGGTLLEDSVTLAAASQLNVPHKILVCMGFGTETEEGLCHYRALENIATYTADGGFLGCCALTPKMEAFQTYRKCCEASWEGKRKSHIHTRIIPAVMGQFGKPTLYDGVDARVAGTETGDGFTTPLMTIIWFFDLMTVYNRSLLGKALLKTNTSTDALMVYRQLLPELMRVPRLSMPVPL
jgi:hypothetical protein